MPAPASLFRSVALSRSLSVAGSPTTKHTRGDGDGDGDGQVQLKLQRKRFVSSHDVREAVEKQRTADARLALPSQ